jgi:hypothetical protein
MRRLLNKCWFPTKLIPQRYQGGDLNDTLGRKEMFPRNQRLIRADLGGSPAILGVGLGLWPRVVRR